ncbi:Aste57867_20991 [Aphanomyces stellatus]|uniref:Aste57867_20991 protein n=1 Tax=Aphanomyces stellatus TaxID=120398 RepID=A0A485LGI1_9STRA|nr:hypothetical protein As57867_020923 [Aphanomyces stellatus]VFT97666.1 Aste57867_20991 [Aphanomyces stellatus]
MPTPSLKAAATDNASANNHSLNPPTPTTAIPHGNNNPTNLSRNCCYSPSGPDDLCTFSWTTLSSTAAGDDSDMLGEEDIQLLQERRPSSIKLIFRLRHNVASVPVSTCGTTGGDAGRSADPT